MRFSSLLVFALMVAPAAHAQEIVDPDPGTLNPAEIVEKVPGMPTRGSTKERVLANLGEPNRRVPAVGDPPISRWVYGPFTVYFEHDRVLHSVKNDSDR